MKYILVNKEVVAVDDIREWELWMSQNKKRIASVSYLSNGVRVSTVFLGIDHGFGSKVPVLFETMIFGGKHDQYQERYVTWDEAKAGHEVAVSLANNGWWDTLYIWLSRIMPNG